MKSKSFAVCSDVSNNMTLKRFLLDAILTDLNSNRIPWPKGLILWTDGATKQLKNMICAFLAILRTCMVQR